jgi:L-ribulose-5-phosphate 4-epimerase
MVQPTPIIFGAIPCTRKLNEDEINQAYEVNTGKVIVEHFQNSDHSSIPGILVKNHGPFSWGKNPADAIHNAVVMEEVAKMAFRTEVLGNKQPVDEYLLNKHYNRKHGKDAYYGQKKTK